VRVPITVYDDSEEVREAIEIRITWFKAERDGRCECYIREKEGGCVGDYFRERNADECLRVKSLSAHTALQPPRREKKSIYIIFKGALDIELEIWISDAQRVG
jgi:hypothetical protein